MACVLPTQPSSQYPDYEFFMVYYFVDKLFSILLELPEEQVVDFSLFETLYCIANKDTLIKINEPRIL